MVAISGNMRNIFHVLFFMYMISCKYATINNYLEVGLMQNDTGWTFFSNHGHIYFLLATNENIVLREVALKVGITERSVLGIVQDLEEAGFIKREKTGRSNKYKIVAKKTLRHPLESNVQLKDLTQLIQEAKKSK